MNLYLSKLDLYEAPFIQTRLEGEQYKGLKYVNSNYINIIKDIKVKQQRTSWPDVPLI